MMGSMEQKRSYINIFQLVYKYVVSLFFVCFWKHLFIGFNRTHTIFRHSFNLLFFSLFLNAILSYTFKYYKYLFYLSVSFHLFLFFNPISLFSIGIFTVFFKSIIMAYILFIGAIKRWYDDNEDKLLKEFTFVLFYFVWIESWLWLMMTDPFKYQQSLPV